MIVHVFTSNNDYFWENKIISKSFTGLWWVMDWDYLGKKIFQFFSHIISSFQCFSFCRKFLFPTSKSIILTVFSLKERKKTVQSHRVTKWESSRIFKVFVISFQDLNFRACIYIQIKKKKTFCILIYFCVQIRTDFREFCW